MLRILHRIVSFLKRKKNNNRKAIKLCKIPQTNRWKMKIKIKIKNNGVSGWNIYLFSFYVAFLPGDSPNIIIFKKGLLKVQ